MTDTLHLNLRQYPIIPLDFETYYHNAAGYTLSKMLTVDYVMDPRYQTIGMALGWSLGSAPYWFVGEHLIRDCFDSMRRMQERGQRVVIAAHNAKFDAAIASLRYGFYPDLIIDTMSIARTLGLAMAGESISLANLRDRVVARWPELVAQLPPKGHEVASADGLRLENFPPHQLAQYGRYSCNDQTLLAWLVHIFLDLIPHEEVIWQTQVIKAYTEPRLKIRRDIVIQERERVIAKRHALRQELMGMLRVTDEVRMQKVINSNEKFATLLKWFGVTPPTKFSTRTKSMTYAFSKKDDEFLELQEHPNETVAMLVEARLGLKSSIELSRCDAFEAEAVRGFAPVPYVPSGALSHRLGGCLTANTMVSCLQVDGSIRQKRIVDVLLSDLVWDGLEFVEHEGVAYRGVQEVIEYDGICGTKCHPVFIDEDTAIPLAEAASHGARIVAFGPPADREPGAW